MEKTYTIQKSALYDDVFADVIETLAELAQEEEIPAWGSYDTEKVGRSYPVTDYYITLHAGPSESPGPVVAAAYIHILDNEDTAEVTVVWDEEAFLDSKKLALMNYLKEEEVSEKEIREGHNPHTFEVWKREYMVLNNQERAEKVKEYIQETLWAFRPSFLAKVTGLPEKVFHALTEQCESGNEAILSLVEATCGLGAFVKAAVKADGYGNFLSSYDGEEKIVSVKGVDYYIYRI